MPSPVSSLLSLTGTEGANVILRSFHENLHMKPAFNRHHNFSQISLLQGQAAPTSRVAAAKRIGGGYDKGKPGGFYEPFCARLLTLMLVISGQRDCLWPTAYRWCSDGIFWGQVNRAFSEFCQALNS